MGSFLHKHNTDNVHTRAVIVGLVNLFNSRIQYENILSDTNIEIVNVPFLPNMGGDERFLQDFFTHWGDCIHPRMADGNYDVIPRGVVILTSNTINTTAMTHRFVRASYVKEVNGELQRFNAFLNSIPLTMEFDVEVHTDTLLEAFKIQQAITETFYKVQVFSVNYKGFRVPCQAGFSDNLGIEKTFEFTYQTNDVIKFKFPISVETYFPVIDPTTERRDSNRMSEVLAGNADGGPVFMQGIGGKIYPGDEKVKPPYFVKLLTPSPDETYFSDGVMPITWENTGIISQVTLYYMIEGTDEWVPIIKNLKNTGFFDWKVPFFNLEGKEVESDGISSKVISPSGVDSKVRSLIDSGGSIDRVVVLKEGVGYTNTDIIQVSVVSNPYSPTPTPTAPVIQASIGAAGGVIDGTIIDPGSGFTPSVVTKIYLKVEDNVNPAVYSILQKRGVFAGDIDNTTFPDDRSYITNIIPTVNTLVDSESLVVGLEVYGDGIPKGTTVESIDIVNNKIKLTNDVTSKETNSQFVLSPVNALLTIK